MVQNLKLRHSQTAFLSQQNSCVYFNLYLLIWEEHRLWTESSKHSLSLFCSWILHACNFYLLIVSLSIWTCSIFKGFISYLYVTILTCNLLTDDEHILHVSSTNFQTNLLNGKVVPVHVIRVYRQSSGIAPLILNLSIRWRWVVNCMPQPPYPQYPMKRRFLENRKSLVPARIQTPEYLACS